MRKRLYVILIGVALGGLLLTQIAAAMSSTHYQLNWYTPMTTNGGGTASSTNYAVNLTVGQVAYQSATSTHYQAGLGYWAGAVVAYKIFLPVILR